MRWVIVGLLVLVVAFAVYRISASRAGNSGAVPSGTAGPAQGAIPAITGPRVDGTAEVAGGQQSINVSVTNVYAPNVIHLRAATPASITFSGGQGCTGVVHSRELGFREDLTTGPKTVKIAQPQPGTYSFSCGMDMVFGQVVVE